MHGVGRGGGTRIGRHRYKVGRSYGVSLPFDSRDETVAVAMDDNNLRDNVDRRFRNHARLEVQNSLRLFPDSLLVHLPAGQELLEQSYVSLWYRCDPLVGHGG